MTPHERAGELVERIGQALMAGDRALAVRIAEQALSGLPVMGAEQAARFAGDGNGTETLEQKIWRLGARLGNGAGLGPQWRGLVGKLVSVCGKERALEVLEAAGTAIDPRGYLGACLKQGEHGPTWQLEGEALTAEAERLNVDTYGKRNEEVRRGIEEARRAERSAAAGGRRRTAGLGAQALRGP